MSIAAFGQDGAPPPIVESPPAVVVEAAKEDCIEGVHLFGGVLTIDWDAPTPCDLTPPMSLNLVWNASNYSGWVENASVHFAHKRCDESGGSSLIWFTEYDYRGVCVGIDY